MSVATCSASRPFATAPPTLSFESNTIRVSGAGEQTGTWVPIVGLDCRGLEPVAFHAEVRTQWLYYRVSLIWRRLAFVLVSMASEMHVVYFG